MRVEHQDYYHSFATYYRRWPMRARVLEAQARRLIEEHDAVVLRVPSPMMGLVTRHALSKKKPLIMMILGNIETQANGIITSRGLKRLFYKAAVKFFVMQEIRCARQASIVYAYSREIARRHQACNGRVRLMQDPLLRLSEIVLRDDTCSSDEVRILRVCWLIPSKGLEYLLQAVALLVAKGRRVRLEIVGKERSAGYQEKLKRLAAELGIGDRVIFSGWVPFDEMQDVYLRSDIQVVSSLAEGTPRCIVEGFARGVPLVCTATGGCADILTDQENALLVSPKDPRAIAEAVERLIRDSALRRGMIKRGYEMARAACFETLGSQFLAELNRVVSHSPGPE